MMNTAKASDSQWRQALSIAPLAVINRLSEIFNDQEEKKKVHPEVRKEK